jgi:hypothetical protein
MDMLLDFVSKKAVIAISLLIKAIESKNSADALHKAINSLDLVNEKCISNCLLIGMFDRELIEPIFNKLRTIPQCLSHPQLMLDFMCIVFIFTNDIKAFRDPKIRDGLFDFMLHIYDHKWFHQFLRHRQRLSFTNWLNAMPTKREILLSSMKCTSASLHSKKPLFKYMKLRPTRQALDNRHSCCDQIQELLLGPRLFLNTFPSLLKNIEPSTPTLVQTKKSCGFWQVSLLFFAVLTTKLEQLSSLQISWLILFGWYLISHTIQTVSS